MEKDHYETNDSWFLIVNPFDIEDEPDDMEYFDTKDAVFAFKALYMGEWTDD